MKSSEALKKARIRIAEGISTHVCNAISWSDGENTAVYKSLYSMFLGDSVSSWLIANSDDYREFVRYASPDFFDTTMRDYRLRWIDWMIPQYEVVGD